MIKKFVLWILVIGCMATIFGFSSQVAEESKKTSSKVITKVVETVCTKKLTKPQKEKITEDLTFIVRKGAHFLIYALLGLLIFLLALEYGFSLKKCAVIAVIASFIYACSDEFHQTFISGRSGELRDIIIDTIGASVGCLIVILSRFIVKQSRKRRSI